MCKEVGKMIANLHNLTLNFDEKRPNSLDLKDWKNIYKKCVNNKSKEFNETMYLLKNEIDYLEKYWPSNIPCCPHCHYFDLHLKDCLALDLYSHH